MYSTQNSVVRSELNNNFYGKLEKKSDITEKEEKLFKFLTTDQAVDRALKNCPYLDHNYWIIKDKLSQMPPLGKREFLKIVSLLTEPTKVTGRPYREAKKGENEIPSFQVAFPIGELLVHLRDEAQRLKIPLKDIQIVGGMVYWILRDLIKGHLSDIGMSEPELSAILDLPPSDTDFRVIFPGATHEELILLKQSVLTFIAKKICQREGKVLTKTEGLVKRKGLTKNFIHPKEPPAGPIKQDEEDLFATIAFDNKDIVLASSLKTKSLFVHDSLRLPILSLLPSMKSKKIGPFKAQMEKVASQLDHYSIVPESDMECSWQPVIDKLCGVLRSTFAHKVNKYGLPLLSSGITKGKRAVQPELAYQLYENFNKEVASSNEERANELIRLLKNTLDNHHVHHRASAAFSLTLNICALLHEQAPDLVKRVWEAVHPQFQMAHPLAGPLNAIFNQGGFQAVSNFLQLKGFLHLAVKSTPEFSSRFLMQNHEPALQIKMNEQCVLFPFKPEAALSALKDSSREIHTILSRHLFPISPYVLPNETPLGANRELFPDLIPTAEALLSDPSVEIQKVGRHFLLLDGIYTGKLSERLIEQIPECFDDSNFVESLQLIPNPLIQSIFDRRTNGSWLAKWTVSLAENGRKLDAFQLWMRHKELKLGLLLAEKFGKERPDLAIQILLGLKSSTSGSALTEQIRKIYEAAKEDIKFPLLHAPDLAAGLHSLLDGSMWMEDTCLPMLEGLFLHTLQSQQDLSLLSLVKAKNFQPNSQVDLAEFWFKQLQKTYAWPQKGPALALQAYLLMEAAKVPLSMVQIPSFRVFFSKLLDEAVELNPIEKKQVLQILLKLPDVDNRVSHLIDIRKKWPKLSALPEIKRAMLLLCREVREESPSEVELASLLALYKSMKPKLEGWQDLFIRIGQTRSESLITAVCELLKLTMSKTDKIPDLEYFVNFMIGGISCVCEAPPHNALDLIQYLPKVFDLIQEPKFEDSRLKILSLTCKSLDALLTPEFLPNNRGQFLRNFVNLQNYLSEKKWHVCVGVVQEIEQKCVAIFQGVCRHIAQCQPPLAFSEWKRLRPIRHLDPHSYQQLQMALLDNGTPVERFHPELSKLFSEYFESFSPSERLSEAQKLLFKIPKIFAIRSVRSELLDYCQEFVKNPTKRNLKGLLQIYPTLDPAASQWSVFFEAIQALPKAQKLKQKALQCYLEVEHTSTLMAKPSERKKCMMAALEGIKGECCAEFKTLLTRLPSHLTEMFQADSCEGDRPRVVSIIAKGAARYLAKENDKDVDLSANRARLIELFAKQGWHTLKETLDGSLAVVYAGSGNISLLEIGCASLHNELQKIPLSRNFEELLSSFTAHLKLYPELSQKVQEKILDLFTAASRRDELNGCLVPMIEALGSSSIRKFKLKGWELFEASLAEGRIALDSETSERLMQHLVVPALGDESTEFATFVQTFIGSPVFSALPKDKAVDLFALFIEKNRNGCFKEMCQVDQLMSLFHLFIQRIPNLSQNIHQRMQTVHLAIDLIHHLFVQDGTARISLFSDLMAACSLQSKTQISQNETRNTLSLEQELNDYKIKFLSFYAWRWFSSENEKKTYLNALHEEVERLSQSCHKDKKEFNALLEKYYGIPFSEQEQELAKIHRHHCQKNFSDKKSSFSIRVAKELLQSNCPQAIEQAIYSLSKAIPQFKDSPEQLAENCKLICSSIEKFKGRPEEKLQLTKYFVKTFFAQKTLSSWGEKKDQRVIRQILRRVSGMIFNPSLCKTYPECVTEIYREFLTSAYEKQWFAHQYDNYLHLLEKLVEYLKSHPVKVGQLGQFFPLFCKWQPSNEKEMEKRADLFEHFLSGYLDKQMNSEGFLEAFDLFVKSDQKKEFSIYAQVPHKYEELLCKFYKSLIESLNEEEFKTVVSRLKVHETRCLSLLLRPINVMFDSPLTELALNRLNLAVRIIAEDDLKLAIELMKTSFEGHYPVSLQSYWEKWIEMIQKHPKGGLKEAMPVWSYANSRQIWTNKGRDSYLNLLKLFCREVFVITDEKRFFTKEFIDDLVNIKETVFFQENIKPLILELYYHKLRESKTREVSAGLLTEELLQIEDIVLLYVEILKKNLEEKGGIYEALALIPEYLRIKPQLAAHPEFKLFFLQLLEKALGQSVDLETHISYVEQSVKLLEQGLLRQLVKEDSRYESQLNTLCHQVLAFQNDLPSKMPEELADGAQVKLLTEEKILEQLKSIRGRKEISAEQFKSLLFDALPLKNHEICDNAFFIIKDFLKGRNRLVGKSGELALCLVYALHIVRGHSFQLPLYLIKHLSLFQKRLGSFNKVEQCSIFYFLFLSLNEVNQETLISIAPRLPEIKDFFQSLSFEDEEERAKINQILIEIDLMWARIVSGSGGTEVSASIIDLLKGMMHADAQENQIARIVNLLTLEIMNPLLDSTSNSIHPRHEEICEISEGLRVYHGKIDSLTLIESLITLGTSRACFEACQHASLYLRKGGEVNSEIVERLLEVAVYCMEKSFNECHLYIFYTLLELSYSGLVESRKLSYIAKACLKKYEALYHHHAEPLSKDDPFTVSHRKTLIAVFLDHLQWLSDSDRAFDTYLKKCFNMVIDFFHFDIDLYRECFGELCAQLVLFCYRREYGTVVHLSPQTLGVFLTAKEVRLKMIYWLTFLDRQISFLKKQIANSSFCAPSIEEWFLLVCLHVDSVISSPQFHDKLPPEWEELCCKFKELGKYLFSEQAIQMHRICCYKINSMKKK